MLHVITAKHIINDTGNCNACGSSIEKEASVVNGVHYHPTCFNCDDCKQPLGTEKYYIIRGKNYCNLCKNVSQQSVIKFLCRVVHKMYNIKYQLREYFGYNAFSTFRTIWKLVANVVRVLRITPYGPRTQMKPIIQTVLSALNVDKFCMGSSSKRMMETICVKQIFW